MWLPKPILNMSNALIELAVEKNTIIEQKYLEVGHTQMEVDSIHSSIERKLPPHRDIFIDDSKLIEFKKWISEKQTYNDPKTKNARTVTKYLKKTFTVRP